ncbi:MAG: 4-(cytidine 5'-diphospho)-2-C-methyl-D-erythritol kinase [Pseudomonadota bacterium]
MQTVLAPAKVNLYLHVGPPNQAGRHPLDSLVVFAGSEAADRLTVEPADAVQLAVIGPQADACGDISDNLVFRAADALKKTLGTKAGARLTLVKHLPVAAGIGGGSADAGAALRALNKLWGGPDDVDHLIAIAAHLGGDVPACVISQPVIMRGEGERLSGVTLPFEIPAILVNSSIPCPTGSIFKAFDAAEGGTDFAEQATPKFGTLDDLLEWLPSTFNDLEPPALTHHPELAKTLKSLQVLENVECVRMSGSGGTCFALFKTMDDAHHAGEVLKTENPDWWIAVTKLGGS